jgi:O-antigen/teichoic acid export membrane protein
MASAITATIYLKVDQIMLGVMTGPEDVGIYAAASQLSEVWWFIPLMLMASLFPSLISLRQKDKAAYHERLASIFAGLGWFGIALAAFVALSAPWLVRIVFGPGFEESVVVLRIHVWAMPFLFMRAALSRWIIMEGVYIVSLITHGAGAITNIVLNLVLIPRYGPVGAALATVVSYSVASFFSLFVYQGTRGVAGLMTRSVVFPRRHVAKLIGRRNR